MTRTTDLIPSVQERICKALREGLHVHIAARLGGVHPATYYHWLKRGSETEEQPYVDFVEAVEQAQAEAQERAIGLIQKHAVGFLQVIEEEGEDASGPWSKTKKIPQADWKAAAWLMERRHPEDWGIRQKVEHSGSVGLTKTGWERE